MNIGSTPLARSAMRPPRRLRIAQIAPLAESVPPERYGGTERVVAYLSEALAGLGHDIALFASGDSTANVPRVDCCAESLRSHASPCDPAIWSILQLQSVIKRRNEFDVVHFHSGYLHLLVHERIGTFVTTLHGRIDRDPAALYALCPEAPFVSISDSQRRPQPQANWVRTVYHGLPRDLLRPGRGDGRYLAFVGRLAPEKRVDRAIEIAQATGMPLRIMAKIDAADTAYFAREVRHLLGKPGVEFIGEGDESAKGELLAGASALLFPIDWPEPFGLVMIEALACATPVIAFRNGSVPEVIEHGHNGFVIDSVRQGIDAVRHLDHIDRDACRATFLQRFTAERMARDYVEVYRTLVERSPQRAHASGTVQPSWRTQSR